MTNLILLIPLNIITYYMVIVNIVRNDSLLPTYANRDTHMHGNMCVLNEQNFAGAAGLFSAQWEKVKGGCLFDKRHAGTDVNAGGHRDQ